MNKLITCIATTTIKRIMGLSLADPVFKAMTHWFDVDDKYLFFKEFRIEDKPTFLKLIVDGTLIEKRILQLTELSTNPALKQ